MNETVVLIARERSAFICYALLAGSSTRVICSSQTERDQATRQIAETLHMSKATVQVLPERIKRELGQKESASMVHFAIQWTASQGRGAVTEDRSRQP